MSTRIELSSGESVYVDADPGEVVGAFPPEGGWALIGDVYVNGAQVTQIESSPVPSILTPKRLHQEA